MTVTETSHGRVLAYLTQQELELLQVCVGEVLDQLDVTTFKGVIGYEREEARALIRQLADAISMIKRGTEPDAFGQLRPKH